MTAPGAWPQVPTWRIDGMTFPGKPTVDDQGREWQIIRGGEVGWQGSPKPRTTRSARPAGDGSFRSRSYRGERVLTLKGYVACPTEDSREETERELAALCSDGGRLYEYRRTTARYDQVAYVELDDEVLLDNPAGTFNLTYSFQFAAPDPRIHDFGWQRSASTLPVGGVGGIDPDSGVLNSSGYIETGTDSEPSIARIANYGTATARPVFTISGAITQPVIVNLETGDQIGYAGSLGPDDVLTINCDEHPQMDLLPHSVLLNGTQNVRSLVRHPVDWPQVDPQAVSQFQLQATGSSTAELVTALRSAYV